MPGLVGWSFIGEVPAPSGGAYDDLTLFWRCETTALTAGDYSAGDTTPTFNGASISTSAVQIGTYGLYSPTVYDHAIFVVSSDDIISGAEGRIGFWLRITDPSTANTVVLNASDSTNSTYFRVQINTAGTVRFLWNDGSNHYYDSTTTLSNNTYTFVEFSYDTVANTSTMYFTGVAAPTRVDTITAIAALDELLVGVQVGLSGEISTDNIMVSVDSARDLYALRNLTASPR